MWFSGRFHRRCTQRRSTIPHPIPRRTARRLREALIHPAANSGATFTALTALNRVVHRWQRSRGDPRKIGPFSGCSRPAEVAARARRRPPVERMPVRNLSDTKKGAPGNVHNRGLESAKRKRGRRNDWRGRRFNYLPSLALALCGISHIKQNSMRCILLLRRGLAIRVTSRC